MITKHFLKTLILFIVMIIIGLIGVAFVSYLNEDEAESATKDVSYLGSKVVILHNNNFVI